MHQRSSTEWLAIFNIANIRVYSMFAIRNEYYPHLTQEYPWYLVLTEYGPITVGTRKRVLSINWVHTGVETKIHNDPICDGSSTEVSNDITWTHAWSDIKAASYLVEFSKAASLHFQENEGKYDYHNASKHMPRLYSNT